MMRQIHRSVLAVGSPVWISYSRPELTLSRGRAFVGLVRKATLAVDDAVEVFVTHSTVANVLLRQVYTFPISQVYLLHHGIDDDTQGFYGADTPPRTEEQHAAQVESAYLSMLPDVHERHLVVVTEAHVQDAIRIWLRKVATAERHLVLQLFSSEGVLVVGWLLSSPWPTAKTNTALWQQAIVRRGQRERHGLLRVHLLSLWSGGEGIPPLELPIDYASVTSPYALSTSNSILYSLLSYDGVRVARNVRRLPVLSDIERYGELFVVTGADVLLAFRSYDTSGGVRVGYVSANTGDASYETYAESAVHGNYVIARIVDTADTHHSADAPYHWITHRSTPGLDSVPYTKEHATSLASVSSATLRVLHTVLGRKEFGVVQQAYLRTTTQLAQANAAVFRHVLVLQRQTEKENLNFVSRWLASVRDGSADDAYRGELRGLVNERAILLRSAFHYRLREHAYQAVFLRSLYDLRGNGKTDMRWVYMQLYKILVASRTPSYAQETSTSKLGALALMLNALHNILLAAHALGILPLMLTADKDAGISDQDRGTLWQNNLLYAFSLRSALLFRRNVLPLPEDTPEASVQSAEWVMNVVFYSMYTTQLYLGVDASSMVQGARSAVRNTTVRDILEQFDNVRISSAYECAATETFLGLEAADLRVRDFVARSEVGEAGALAKPRSDLHAFRLRELEMERRRHTLDPMYPLMDNRRGIYESVVLISQAAINKRLDDAVDLRALAVATNASTSDGRLYRLLTALQHRAVVCAQFAHLVLDNTIFGDYASHARVESFALPTYVEGAKLSSKISDAKWSSPLFDAKIYTHRFFSKETTDARSYAKDARTGWLAVLRYVELRALMGRNGPALVQFEGLGDNNGPHTFVVHVPDAAFVQFHATASQTTDATVTHAIQDAKTSYKSARSDLQDSLKENDVLPAQIVAANAKLAALHKTLDNLTSEAAILTQELAGRTAVDDTFAKTIDISVNELRTRIRAKKESWHTTSRAIIDQVTRVDELHERRREWKRIHRIRYASAIAAEERMLALLNEKAQNTERTAAFRESVIATTPWSAWPVVRLVSDSTVHRNVHVITVRPYVDGEANTITAHVPFQRFATLNAVEDAFLLSDLDSSKSVQRWALQRLGNLEVLRDYFFPYSPQDDTVRTTWLNKKGNVDWDVQENDTATYKQNAKVWTEPLENATPETLGAALESYIHLVMTDAHNSSGRDAKDQYWLFSKNNIVSWKRAEVVQHSPLHEYLLVGYVYESINRLRRAQSPRLTYLTSYLRPEGATVLENGTETTSYVHLLRIGETETRVVRNDAVQRILDSALLVIQSMKRVVSSSEDALREQEAYTTEILRAHVASPQVQSALIYRDDHQEGRAHLLSYYAALPPLLTAYTLFWDAAGLGTMTYNGYASLLGAGDKSMDAEVIDAHLLPPSEFRKIEDRTTDDDLARLFMRSERVFLKLHLDGEELFGVVLRLQSVDVFAVYVSGRELDVVLSADAAVSRLLYRAGVRVTVDYALVDRDQHAGVLAALNAVRAHVMGGSSIRVRLGWLRYTLSVSNRLQLPQAAVYALYVHPQQTRLLPVEPETWSDSVRAVVHFTRKDEESAWAASAYTRARGGDLWYDHTEEIPVTGEEVQEVFVSTSETGYRFTRAWTD